MNEKTIKKATDMTKKVVKELDIKNEMGKVGLFKYILDRLEEDKWKDIYIAPEEPKKK